MSDRDYYGDLFSPETAVPKGRNPFGFPSRVKDTSEALKVHREKLRHTIATVRSMALTKYYRLNRPISVNDIRDEWASVGPLSADCRAIGAVFASKDWRKVGTVASDAPNSNAGRVVGLFVPAHVEQPEGDIAKAFRAGFTAGYHCADEASSLMGGAANRALDDAIATYLAEVT